MNDPTHFENLKVAFENRLYDLDNIQESILITNRSDLLDLADLSRKLTIELELRGRPEIRAEIVLEATVKELAGEIMEVPDIAPGCSLSLFFYKEISEVERQYPLIEEALADIWESDVAIGQTLQFPYEKGADTERFINMTEVRFLMMLSEEQMGEIVPFLEHVLESMEKLHEI